MKLHNYADDALVKRLNELSAAATPGPWQAEPKRLTVPLSDGTVAQGPLMSYLVGYQGSAYVPPLPPSVRQGAAA